MRVLLTGATGFIGRAVAQALERRGHAVVRVQRRPAASGEALVQADFAATASRLPLTPPGSVPMAAPIPSVASQKCQLTQRNE